MIKGCCWTVTEKLIDRARSALNGAGGSRFSLEGHGPKIGGATTRSTNPARTRKRVLPRIEGGYGQRVGASGGKVSAGWRSLQSGRVVGNPFLVLGFRLGGHFRGQPPTCTWSFPEFSAAVTLGG